MPSTDPELSRALAARAIEGGLLRLKWLAAATRFELALLRHDRALKYNFNPNEPRVPRGNPGGGQWTRVAGGGPEFERERSRYGESFPGATYGQLVRLDLEVARTQNALAQIRRYDPKWMPAVESLTAPGSIEGSIRNAQARAEQAEAYLNRLRTGIGGNFGPPLESAEPPRAFDGEAWINAYRAVNNMPDLFGRPTWPLDSGTVAVTDIDGRLYFGVNSGAPGYTTADRNDANSWRWTMINANPDLMQSSNIGSMPNDSFYHAESTILLRAARDNSGNLAGRTIEIQVDRPLCTSCSTVLPRLGLELGNPTVTYVDTKTGTRSTMRDGRWLP